MHAWWHQPYVDEATALRATDLLLQGDLLQAAFTPGTSAYEAISGLTKGLEMALPPGAAFLDHGGHQRHAVRLRWWHAPASSYRDMALVQPDQREAIPDVPLAAPLVSEHGSVPTFIGHYWMTGTPAVLTPTVACVDYSAGRCGPLVAYRWDGEATLSNAKFLVGRNP